MEKSNHQADRVELRCRKCNRYFMNYTLMGKKDAVVLQNIELKCDRCKRMLMLKKCTESELMLHAVNGMYKI